MCILDNKVKQNLYESKDLHEGLPDRGVVAHCSTVVCCLPKHDLNGRVFKSSIHL